MLPECFVLLRGAKPAVTGIPLTFRMFLGRGDMVTFKIPLQRYEHLFKKKGVSPKKIFFISSVRGER